MGEKNIWERIKDSSNCRVLILNLILTLCLNLLLDKKVMVGDGHIWERCAWLLISLVAFLAVSVLYEKKRKIFSVGYLFLLINVFIDGVLCPGYFTGSNIPISVMCETDDR